MGGHIYDCFIYNEENYLLLEIQHRLKQPIDWIETTSEGYIFPGQLISEFLEDEGLELADVIEGKGLIRPEDYGMQPCPMSWANRYSYSTYEITDEGLFLKEMAMGDVADGHKPIQGVMPTLHLGLSFKDSFIYKNLNIFTPLTGRVILCKGLNYSFISCGLIPDIACETLLKITFNKGKLVLIQDLSLGNAIARHMEIQRQQSEGLKGLIERVEPIGLLPPTDNL